jgi:DHA1 family tetracycline resistance protein-like MFS transporter
MPAAAGRQPDAVALSGGGEIAAGRRPVNRRSPALPFILVTVLLDVMGIGLLLPVLPAIVGQFAATREAQAYWYGAMLLTFGTMQFLCAPLLGALSDRYGRRPILLASITGLGLMFLATPLVTSIGALLATRILGGALAANFSVANAYVADISRPEDRARGFGMIGASFGIGFVVGPMAGGLLGHIDIRLPFFAAAALSFLNFAYGLVVLPESLPPERRKAVDFSRANPLAALRGLAKLSGVGVLVAVFALINLAQFILHSVWVLYTGFRFDWGPREAGLSLFVVGLTVAAVQGGLLGVLLKHVGERRLVLLGLASAALAYAGYGLANAGWMMYAIIAANMLAFAVGPALNAIVSKAAPANEQGLAMGALSSLASLVAVIAPMLGTPLLAEASHLPANDWKMGAPFFLSSLLAFVALALALAHFSRSRRPAAV